MAATTKSALTIEKLIESAKKEDWIYVDSVMPSIAKDRNFLTWARSKGIRDNNEHVRDLAVSIIEKTEMRPDEFTSLRVPIRLMMIKDSNKYVRFRAAFALANHGPGLFYKEVEKTLIEAKDDKDVSEIATEYLRNLNSQSQSRS
ncbi:MAG: hypothetical protein ABR981_01940 [Candidatus Micrarchaeaceae archaeon]|jgi:hypothetical protein